MARKPPPPLEHEEQVAVVQWARRHQHVRPCLGLLHASLNGAKLPYRTKIVRGKKVRICPEAKRQKDAGLLNDIPDLYLPHAMGGYHGLYIEMKRVGEKPRESQREMHDRLRAEGYRVEWCAGADAAIEVLRGYLNIPKV